MLPKRLEIEPSSIPTRHEYTLLTTLKCLVIYRLGEGRRNERGYELILYFDKNVVKEKGIVKVSMDT